MIIIPGNPISVNAAYRRIRCKLCNKEFELKSPMGKFCKKCQPIARREIKMRYYLKIKNDSNYIEKAKNYAKKIYSEKSARLSERGKELCRQELNTGILWEDKIKIPKFTNILTFSIPFDWCLSKNAMANFGRGRYWKNPSTTASQEIIIWKIRQTKIKWIQDKLYISILVEKPNQRGDAINFIDTIADGVKKGTEIDDRWFCLERIDWIINKNEPKIWITIKQNNSSAKQVCSYCGRILTLNNFRRNKSARLGITRECKDCISTKTTAK